jgi:hypothetical protein
MEEPNPSNTAANNQNANANASATTNSAHDPVLSRLKDLEDSNNNNAKLLESMQRELKEKDDRIKALSADKRKEMETILSTAIDKWLNSLAGVSEENKANFRQGICKLAERADMNNAAWEIVCHASTTHHNNVLKIEELLSKTQQQEQEIGDLKGFRNEASRISGHKRAREDAAVPPPTTQAAMQRDSHYPSSGGMSSASTSEGKNNTWDLFQSMISRDLGSSYY